MRISQVFNLNKSQSELDFVDIDPTIDLPLFLDPFFLSKRKDRWSIAATQTIKDFFQKVINLIRENKISEAKDLFDHLHEPNSTCLGVSQANPRGRGVGTNDTDKIFESLLKSKAIQTGLLNDIEDSVLFVENFGKDKLSDMTTNIITKLLIDYTINQCELHNIPLNSDIPTGFFWNPDDSEWHTEYSRGLIIHNQRIILVPKGIVSFCKVYTPDRYYNHFVLNFLQNEHLRIKSALVQTTRDGRKYVTKKSLEARYPSSKEFLRRFTIEHPEVLQKFKDSTPVTPLADEEFAKVNINGVTNILIKQLDEIEPGNDGASKYHNLMKGILQMIFYPHLINPKKEYEINEGRKRIDIVFDNASEKGLFKRLSEKLNLPSAYIFVECKNYTRDIKNPELDQMIGRFHVNKGRVGFIVCRAIEDFSLFIQRCRDTFHAGSGLVIPLVDSDIKLLLQNIAKRNHEFVETFLSDRIRSITLG